MLRRLPIALALLFAISLPAFAGSPVNINTADAATLAHALDGVGTSKAEAIVNYRNEHGAFKSADELDLVNGIGASLIERNRANILLSDAEDSTPASTHKTSNKAADSEPVNNAHGAKPPAAVADIAHDSDGQTFQTITTWRTPKRRHDGETVK